MAAYLEDDKRGADLIIAFGAKQGITLNQEEVIAFIDDVDKDEWNIELTPEMLTSVAGAGKCGIWALGALPWHATHAQVALWGGPELVTAKRRSRRGAEFLIDPYRQGVNPDKHW